MTETRPMEPFDTNPDLPGFNVHADDWGDEGVILVIGLTPRTAKGGGQLEAVLDRDQVAALADWLNRWLASDQSESNG